LAQLSDLEHLFAGGRKKLEDSYPCMALHSHVGQYGSIPQSLMDFVVSLNQELQNFLSFG